MLNELISDCMGVVEQAYDWKRSNKISTTILPTNLIDKLVNDKDAPTHFEVENLEIRNEEAYRADGDMVGSVLLFSGGLDSTIAYHYLAYHYLKPDAVLFVNLHIPYSFKEKKKVIEFANDCGMDLMVEDCSLAKWYNDTWKDTIPARNLLLVAIASYYSNKIYLISQRGEMSIADRSKEFYREVSDILSRYYDVNVAVETPFTDMTKQDMVRWYIENGYDTNLLRKTISCFSGVEGQCGSCPACLRKAVALESMNIDCLDLFNRDIREYTGIEGYIERMKKGLYEERRAEQTLNVFRRWGYDC